MDYGIFTTAESLSKEAKNMFKKVLLASLYYKMK
jgi:hypothetical protein